MQGAMCVWEANATLRSGVVVVTSGFEVEANEQILLHTGPYLVGRTPSLQTRATATCGRKQPRANISWATP